MASGAGNKSDDLRMRLFDLLVLLFLLPVANNKSFRSRDPAIDNVSQGRDGPRWQSRTRFVSCRSAAPLNGMRLPDNWLVVSATQRLAHGFVNNGAH